MITVLLVCTGNTCRSSMAEGILRKLLKEENLSDTKVVSAGVAAFPGEGASFNAIEAVKKEDIDLSLHKAQPLTIELVTAADIILAMTSNHKRHILMLAPQIKDKVFTLKEFAYGRESDISDPYGQSKEVYEKCAEEIKLALIETVKKLKEDFI